MNITGKQSDQNNTFFMYFNPEGWGHVTKFRLFFHTTYKFNNLTRHALNGIEGHLRKYEVILSIAREYTPKIQEHSEELERQGYTAAPNAKKLAALIETLYSELYASLDGMRQVLYAVYHNAQGLPSKKTSRLFSNASEGKIGDRVPKVIVDILATAYDDWFRRLRHIRTYVTHVDIGNCWIGDGGKITYTNPAAGSRTKAYVVEDVFKDLGELADHVNRLIDTVFEELVSTLEDDEVKLMCGIYKGRIYERFISIQSLDNWNSGSCYSFRWFEGDKNPTCPLIEHCGAYTRAKKQN
jgi:hypothetical protein